MALIDDFLRPKPPVEIALAAARSGVLCSLMDVSDGLAKDLGRIARASRVWVDLDAPALNMLIGSLGSAAGRLGADRRYWALAGGEDHGFVGTIAADGAVPAGFTVIGEVRGPAEHGRLTLDLADIDSDRITFGSSPLYITKSLYFSFTQFLSCIISVSKDTLRKFVVDFPSVELPIPNRKVSLWHLAVRCEHSLLSLLLLALCLLVAHPLQKRKNLTRL